MTDQQKLSGKIAVDSVVTSGPGGIDWRDVGKGALYAVCSAIIPLIMQSINSWTFDYKTLAQTAASTFLGYLMVKFFSATQQITTFKKS